MKKFFVIGLTVLLVTGVVALSPFSVSAAVVEVNQEAFSSGSNATSLSSDFSVGATLTHLLIWLGHNSPTTNATCSWAGAAMTLVSSQEGTTPSFYLFSLASPATGTQTLLCNWTGSAQPNWAQTGLTGVGSLGTPDKGQVGAGTTNVTTTGTIGADDLFVGALMYNSGTNGVAVVTGTQKAEDGTGSTSGHTLNTANNTSGTITWSRSISAAAAYIGVPVLAPVAAAEQAPVQVPEIMIFN